MGVFKIIQKSIIPPDNITYKDQNAQDFYNSMVDIHKRIEIIYTVGKDIIKNETDPVKIKELKQCILKLASDLSYVNILSEAKLGELLVNGGV